MLFARPTNPRAFALVALFAVVVAFAGCGEKDKSEIAVAEVDDVVITLEYFETKMNSIPAESLPADIALRSGREELLETMVRKEVMVLKAIELGMEEDGRIDDQANRIANLTAVNAMYDDISAGLGEVTEEEIQAYYEMLPRKLTVSYMVFNYEARAAQARGLVEGGENWVEIAEQFEAGSSGRNDNYTMEVRYGTVADDFEREVFALPVGATSDPIETPYGYFIIRVDDVTMERVQPLDQIRPAVAESVKKQKESLARTDFLAGVFEEYDLYINNEALQIVYDGIPEDLPLQPPYPSQEELEPLAVDSEHYDKVLFSCAGQVWTVGRYAQYFNDSSILGRPRREGQPAQLRRKLRETVIREIMDIVAVDRGFRDLPIVDVEYRSRREQLMVSRLNEELISDEIVITPEELDAWWEENQEEYRVPELRETYALICETEAECLSAEIDLAGGASWEEIVETYCVESDVREQKGHVGKMTPETPSPIKDIVYSVEEEGQMAEPTELPDGRWALVKVTEIMPEHIPELATIRSQVGARIRGAREDALFESLIEGWMAEHEIKRYPERLMDAVYAPNPKQQNVIHSGG